MQKKNAVDSISGETSEAVAAKPDLNDVVSKIADAAMEGRLLLFVGTGFSRAVLNWNQKPRKPILGWLDLLDAICKEFQISSDTFFCKRMPKLKYDCPAIATAMVDQVKKGTFYDRSQRIKDTAAAMTSWIPRQRQCAEIGEILRGLNPSAIVTTNYDEILEGLLGEDCESLSRRDEVRIPLRGKIAVWHFHGKRDEPDNIVLSRNDYIQFFRPGNYAQTKLSQLLHEHFTVFVGYSVSDMNLLSALDWAQNVYQTTHGFQGCAKLNFDKLCSIPVCNNQKPLQQVVVEYAKHCEHPLLVGSSPAFPCPVIRTSDVICLLSRIHKECLEKGGDRERFSEGTHSERIHHDGGEVSSLLSSDHELQNALHQLSTEFLDAPSGNSGRKAQIIEILREACRRVHPVQQVSEQTTTVPSIDLAHFLASLLTVFPIPKLPVSLRICLLEKMEGALIDRTSRKRFSTLVSKGSSQTNLSVLQDNLSWLRQVSLYGGCKNSESFAKRALRRLARNARIPRNGK